MVTGVPLTAVPTSGSSGLAAVMSAKAYVTLALTAPPVVEFRPMPLSTTTFDAPSMTAETEDKRLSPPVRDDATLSSPVPNMPSAPGSTPTETLLPTMPAPPTLTDLASPRNNSRFASLRAVLRRAASESLAANPPPSLITPAMAGPPRTKPLETELRVMPPVKVALPRSPPEAIIEFVVAPRTVNFDSLPIRPAPEPSVSTAAKSPSPPRRMPVCNSDWNILPAIAKLLISSPVVKTELVIAAAEILLAAPSINTSPAIVPPTFRLLASLPMCRKVPARRFPPMLTVALASMETTTSPGFTAAASPTFPPTVSFVPREL